MNTCNHRFGDYIDNIWVCSQCYKHLESRPQRLGMIQTIPNGDLYRIGTRQEIIWQAEILQPEGGVKLSVFVESMVRRFMYKCKDMDRAGAIELSLSILKTMYVEYGDTEYDWSRASAIDIVDEELQYFDLIGESNG